MNLMEHASGINKVCPVYRFGVIFKSKWALVILRDLFLKDARRFSEFKENTPQLTDRALTQTLKELGKIKLIERHVQDTSPPSALYQLSELGISLKPVITAMATWGSSELGKKWWKGMRTK